MAAIVLRVPRVPLDHPTLARPHRVYVALTNRCNRACPWCSTFSSPAGTTWLDVAGFLASLPPSGVFQLQLEGGEPTLHPELFGFASLARGTGRCERVVLSTNGVLLPRERDALDLWLARLGAPLTVKLSVNHHLLERDPGLLDLCRLLGKRLDALGGKSLLVVNVRLRRGYEEDDRRVRDAVEEAGLLADANVFFLQRYGLAGGEVGWQPPFLAGDRFTLVNPDGRSFGPDLLARSEAMRTMP